MANDVIHVGPDSSEEIIRVGQDSPAINIHDETLPQAEAPPEDLGLPNPFRQLKDVPFLEDRELVKELPKISDPDTLKWNAKARKSGDFERYRPVVEHMDKSTNIPKDNFWSAITTAYNEAPKNLDGVDIAFRNEGFRLAIDERVGKILQMAEDDPAWKAELLEQYPYALFDHVPEEEATAYHIGRGVGGTYMRTDVTKPYEELLNGEYFQADKLLRLEDDPTTYLAAQRLHQIAHHEKEGGMSWAATGGFLVSAGTETIVDLLVLRGAGKAAQATKVGNYVVKKSQIARKIMNTPWAKRLATAAGLGATSMVTKSTGAFFNNEYSIEEVPKHTAFEVGAYLALSNVGGMASKALSKYKGNAGGRELNKLFKGVTDKIRNGELNKITIDEISDYISVVETIQAIPKDQLSPGMVNFIKKSKGTYNTLKSLIQIARDESEIVYRGGTIESSSKGSTGAKHLRGLDIYGHYTPEIKVANQFAQEAALNKENAGKSIEALLDGRDIDDIVSDFADVKRFKVDTSEFFDPRNPKHVKKLADTGLADEAQIKEGGFTLFEEPEVNKWFRDNGYKGYFEKELDPFGGDPWNAAVLDGKTVQEAPAPLFKSNRILDPATSKRLMNAKKVILDSQEKAMAENTAKTVSELLEEIPALRLKDTEDRARELVKQLQTKKEEFSPRYWKQAAKLIIEDLNGKPESVQALKIAMAEPLSDMHQEILDLMAMGFSEENARAAQVVMDKFNKLMPVMEMYMDITGKASHLLRSFRIAAEEGAEQTSKATSIFDLDPKSLAKLLEDYKMPKTAAGVADTMPPEQAFKKSLKHMVNILGDYKKVMNESVEGADKAASVAGSLMRTSILSMFPMRRLFEGVATMSHDVHKWGVDFAGAVMGTFHRNPDVRWNAFADFSRLFATKKTLTTFLGGTFNKKTNKALWDGFKKKGLSGYFEAFGDNVNILTQGSVEGSFTKNRLAFDEIFKPKDQRKVLDNLNKLTGIDFSGKPVAATKYVWDNIADVAQLVSKNVPMIMDGIQDNLYLQPAAMESAQKLAYKYLQGGTLSQAQADKFMAGLTDLMKLQLKGQATDENTLKLYAEVIDTLDLDKTQIPMFQRHLNEALEGVKHTLANRTWKASLTGDTRAPLTKTFGSLTSKGTGDKASYMWAEFVNPFVRSQVNFVAWGGERIFAPLKLVKSIAAKEDPTVVIKNLAETAVSSLWLGGFFYLRQKGMIRVADRDTTRKERSGLDRVTIELDENSFDLSQTLPNVQSFLKICSSIEPIYQYLDKKSKGELTTMEEENYAAVGMEVLRELALTPAEIFLKTPAFKYDQLKNMDTDDYMKTVSIGMQGFFHSFINHPTAWMMGGFDEEKYKDYIDPSDFIRPTAAAGMDPLVQAKQQIPLFDAGGYPVKDGWSDKEWLNVLQERVIGKNVKRRTEEYLEVARELGADLHGKNMRYLRTPQGGRMEVPREFHIKFNENLRDSKYDYTMNSILAVRHRYTDKGMKDLLEQTSSKIRVAVAKQTLVDLGLEGTFVDAIQEEVESKYKGVKFD